MEFILVDTIDQVFDAAFDGKGATSGALTCTRPSGRGEL